MRRSDACPKPFGVSPGQHKFLTKGIPQSRKYAICLVCGAFLWVIKVENYETNFGVNVQVAGGSFSEYLMAASLPARHTLDVVKYALVRRFNFVATPVYYLPVKFNLVEHLRTPRGTDVGV